MAAVSQRLRMGTTVKAGNQTYGNYRRRIRL